MAITASATAEAVVAMRRAVLGLAARHGASEDARWRIDLAVSEACTNVVVHAYPGHPGPLRLTAAANRHTITVTVTDDGVGLLPAAERGGLGAGLWLIAQLAEGLALTAKPGGGGTALRMVFALHPDPELAPVNMQLNDHRPGSSDAHGDPQRAGASGATDAILAPALAAARRPGWEQVQRELAAALEHRRRGSAGVSAALSAARAALVCAMCAAGFAGHTLQELAAAVRDAHGVPPAFAAVPEIIDELAGRAEPPAPTLVDLGLHWTAIFLVALPDASGGQRTSDR